jgi:hypothetical protein
LPKEGIWISTFLRKFCLKKRDYVASDLNSAIVLDFSCLVSFKMPL